MPPSSSSPALSFYTEADLDVSFCLFPSLCFVNRFKGINHKYSAIRMWRLISVPEKSMQGRTNTKYMGLMVEWSASIFTTNYCKIFKPIL